MIYVTAAGKRHNKDGVTAQIWKLDYPLLFVSGIEALLKGRAIFWSVETRIVANNELKRTVKPVQVDHWRFPAVRIEADVG